MNRLLIILFFCLTAFDIAFGQNPKNESLNKIESTNNTYNTITGKFHQTRTSSLLKEPVISEGKIFIKGKDTTKQYLLTQALSFTAIFAVVDCSTL